MLLKLLPFLQRFIVTCRNEKSLKEKKFCMKLLQSLLNKVPKQNIAMTWISLWEIIKVKRYDTCNYKLYKDKFKIKVLQNIFNTRDVLSI